MGAVQTGADLARVRVEGGDNVQAVFAEPAVAEQGAPQTAGTD